jgi:uncharacterized protein
MHPTRHASFRLFAAGALIALLAACETIPGDSGPASVNRAERLLRQGNHAEAARVYEQLATDNPPPERDQFALTATRAWLDANRADDAQRTLNLISTQLPAAQQFDRTLLQVEVGAARGQYQAAWQQVAALAEPARPEDAARLFYLRQQVALRAGQTSEAVRAGIARDRVAADDTTRNRARRDLLTDLRGAIERGLRIDPATSRDPLERGWLEVAQIASDAGRSPLSANTWIERWRQRYPGHPAATIVGSEILDPAVRPGAGAAPGAVITGPVALLLPLSDPNSSRAAAAALIRDGFQAAVARLPAAAGSFELRAYDTTALTVGGAMQQAVAEGATFIVGPLTREEVLTAAQQRPAQVPVLLLNTLAEGGGPGTWQYALAPEDEARQIARHITGSGGRNVVVLTPAGEWGQRVANAFADELRQTGGTVLAEGVYTTEAENISATVRAALGIDASRERHRRLQGILGRQLAFDARPSAGIDAIFTAGFQPQAVRQINPLLSFHNAGDIATYVTSDGVSEERTANRDLAGMRLLEMPWMLDTAGAAHDVRLATEGSWRARGLRDSRMFAFGYEAATLAAALRRGQTAWPLDGVTGRLSLTPTGRVERSLNWARVQRDGTVQPADPLTR